MPSLPTHDELVAAYQAEVVGDPDSNLTDFSDGSVNRGFAGIAATAAQGAYRWMARLVAGAFVQSATGSDLDYVVADRVGDALPRLTDETDEAYRTRYYAYIEALGRGTQAAWDFWRDNVLTTVDENASTITEDLSAPNVAITLQGDGTATEPEIQADVGATLSDWRILGIPTTLTITP